MVAAVVLEAVDEKRKTAHTVTVTLQKAYKELRNIMGSVRVSSTHPSTGRHRLPLPPEDVKL